VLRRIGSRGSVEDSSIRGIVVPSGSTPGVSICDDRGDAAGAVGRPLPAGQGDDALLVIAEDGSELRRSHAIRELAIQALGAVFQWLAVVPVAIGFVRAMELLGGTERSRLVGLLGDWSRGVLQPPGANEFLDLFLPVGLPLLVAVLAAWFCLGLGWGLRQHSPAARWTAVVVLAAACVPPLTLAFQASWGRAYGMTAGAFAIAAIPAILALTLSATASDVLFTPKYRALVRAAPLRRDELGTSADLSFKFGLIGLGVVAVFILVVLAQ
jgi:hypothetical protein